MMLKNDLKNYLRKKILKQRLGFTRSFCQQSSIRIFSILYKWRYFLCAKNILFYSSVNNELSLNTAIHYTWLNKKNVFLPRIVGQDILFYRVVDWDNCRRGSFNILEPLNGFVISISECDLMFIPGLAFDKRGYRLGYGGGFYDRLLCNSDHMKCDDKYVDSVIDIKNKTLIIGIVYKEFLFEELPIEDHDIPVDIILTPDGFY